MCREILWSVFWLRGFGIVGFKDGEPFTIIDWLKNRGCWANQDEPSGLRAPSRDLIVGTSRVAQNPVGNISYESSELVKTRFAESRGCRPRDATPKSMRRPGTLTAGHPRGHTLRELIERCWVAGRGTQQSEAMQRPGTSSVNSKDD